MTTTSDRPVIFENREPRTCRYIHNLIRGYVEISFSRYLQGLAKPQPYKCGRCGREFMRPDDFDDEG